MDILDSQANGQTVFFSTYLVEMSLGSTFRFEISADNATVATRPNALS